MAQRVRVRGLQVEEVSFSPTPSPPGFPGTAGPSAAPTSFINAESIAAAASSLSSAQIGGIVVACLVVALVVGGVYFYKKKHSGGHNLDYASTESAALT